MSAAAIPYTRSPSGSITVLSYRGTLVIQTRDHHGVPTLWVATDPAASMAPLEGPEGFGLIDMHEGQSIRDVLAAVDLLHATPNT